jgi:UDP-glucose 4-epimerase
MDKAILLTGSSGFIGATLCEDLLNKGYKVIGLDIIISTRSHKNYQEYNIDISDANAFTLLSNLKISAVLHLAAKIRVDESMSNPEMYYKHNVIGTINLLNWCQSNDIRNIVFASTAGVYGEISIGVNGYIEEEAANPVSVYGRTKLMCENILQDYALAYSFKGYIFRFFNVCGGSELNHGAPIHLVPLVVNNILNNRDVSIFGTDYKTRDGTCIRDYVHLKDISNAFILAYEKGFDFNGFKVYNLGSGEGFSVKEMINEIYKVMSNKINIKSKILCKDRRPGDADILVANSGLAYKELGWKWERGLEVMIEDTITDFLTRDQQKTTVREDVGHVSRKSGEEGK